MGRFVRLSDRSAGASVERRVPGWSYRVDPRWARASGSFGYRVDPWRRRSSGGYRGGRIGSIRGETGGPDRSVIGSIRGRLARSALFPYRVDPPGNGEREASFVRRNGSIHGTDPVDSDPCRLERGQPTCYPAGAAAARYAWSPFRAPTGRRLSRRPVSTIGPRWRFRRFPSFMSSQSASSPSVVHRVAQIRAITGRRSSARGRLPSRRIASRSSSGR